MSKEVVNKPDNAPAQQVPSFMQGRGGQGTENLDRGDYEMPVIQLLQGISPQVLEEGCAAGQFYHSVAEKELGTELRIVPLFVTTRYVLWNPLWDGGGILARADDGKNWSPPMGEFEIHPTKGVKRSVTWTLKPTVAESGLGAWGSYDPEDSNSPPAATYGYYIVVQLLDFPELSPAVIRMSRASIKMAKKFMAKLKISEAPSYGMIFKMSSWMDTNNDSQQFMNYKFRAEGLIEDEDLFKTLESRYELFRSEGLDIKDEAKTQETAPNKAEADDGKGDF